MLAQYGYFYTQRFSNMNEQGDLDTVPNAQSNDKPYLRARKSPQVFFTVCYSCLFIFATQNGQIKLRQ